MDVSDKLMDEHSKGIWTYIIFRIIFNRRPSKEENADRESKKRKRTAYGEYDCYLGSIIYII